MVHERTFVTPTSPRPRLVTGRRLALALAVFAVLGATGVSFAQDLSIDKRHSGDFVVGRNHFYEFVLRNVGTVATTGTITVRDTLPTGLTFITGGPSGWNFSFSGGALVATHAGPIDPGGVLLLSVTVRVNAAAAPAVTNSAVVSTPGDVNAANDYDADPTTVIEPPDLSIDKRHEVDFFAGQDGTYTLVVSNIGSGPTTAATTVTDTLPAGVVFVSGGGAGWSVGESSGVVTAVYAATLAPGDSASITLTVNPSGDAAVPQVVNAATVVTPGEANLANNRDVDPTNVLSLPDLSLTKQHTGNFIDGTNATYDFLIQNNGSTRTFGAITILDTLPAGLTFVGGSGAGWAYSETGGVVTGTHLGPVLPGGTLPTSLTVAVGPLAVPLVVNAATVVVANEVNPIDNRATDSAVVVGQPDLALAKRHDSPFVLGSTGAYTLTVHNAGSAVTANSITVVDTLPPGLSFATASGADWLVSASGPVVTATTSVAIAAGDSSSFNITVDVAPAAVPSVTNSAVASMTGDPNPANDRAVVVTPVGGVPDLSLDKRHTGDFVVGGNHIYEFELRNVGSATTTGPITVRDTLPAGLTFVTGGPAGWIFSFASGAMVATHPGPINTGGVLLLNVTVRATAAAVPQVINSAAVSTPGDVNATNNYDADPTNVVRPPDLTIDKRHLLNFRAGVNGSYTLVATNVGLGSTRAATTVRDTLPPGISFVSGSGTGWAVSAVGSIVTAIHADTIAAGDSAKFTLTVNPSGDAAVPLVVNAATVVTNLDGNTANNRDRDSTRVLSLPELRLTKSHTALFIDGSNAAYNFVIENNGPTQSFGTLTLLDTLPAGLSFVGGSGTGWSFSESGGIVTATNPGPLLPGGVSFATLTVGVGAAAVPFVVNSATLLAANDQNPNNNFSADNTVVIGRPDLTITKRHDAPFVMGGVGSYTLTVHNVGTAVTANAITVRDTLPVGLTFVSAPVSDWTVTTSGQVVTATLPIDLLIAQQDSSGFAFTVDVQPSAYPSVINSAVVSMTGDSNPANNRAVVVTPVGGPPDLSIDKRHGAFTVGVEGDYTIVVANEGLGSTTGTITVTDTLPASLQFVRGVGLGWTLVANGQVVTATHDNPLGEGDGTSIAITVRPTIAALPSVTNSASVTTAGDTNPTNDRDVDVAPVIGPPDLSMVKRHVGVFQVGSTGVYQFLLQNRGASPTTGPITIRDTLPAGLDFVSGSGAGWTFIDDVDVIAIYDAPVAPNALVICSITVQVGPLALPSVQNTAFAAVDGDLNTDNNGSTDLTVVAGSPDLTLDKRHTDVFLVGGNARYEFIVQNLGTTPTFGPSTVIDTLPPGLAFISGSGSGWSFTTAGNVVNAVTSNLIAPGTPSFFSMTVGIAPTTPPSIVNRAVVVTDFDLTPENNGDEDLTVVVGAADLALFARPTPAFRVGEIGTFAFTVRNVGTATTGSTITVRDTLPAGLTFSVGTGSGWSFATSGNVVTATTTDLFAQGDSTTFEIQVAVGAAAVPQVVNSAVLSGGGDANPSNNRVVSVTNVAGEGTLAVALAASPSEVEIGDLLNYQLSVASTGVATVLSTEAVIELPSGVAYRPGTSQMDGATVADPAGSPGPVLRYSLGNIAPGRTVALTFRAEVGAGAERSERPASATVSGLNQSNGVVVASNAATAAVTVVPGVFTDEGVIAGRVFLDRDCNGDRAQNGEDLGIPGVRLYLEDGSSAITDVEGKYHFNHVRPQLHVVRVDESTLPAGARMVPAANRHGDDGASRFVDLKRGELHRADFVEGSADTAVANAVRRRHRGGEVAGPLGPGNAPANAEPATAAESAGGSPRADGPRAGEPSLLAMGLVQARLDVHSLTESELNGARHDRFEEELRDLTVESDDGATSAGVRAAVFATGTVADSIRVSLGYDTERKPERRLFRDIRPHENYEILGDASVHGFEAQTASRLYARVERGTAAFLFGDFETPASEARELGSFSRRLTGGVATWHGAPVAGIATQAAGFASEGIQRQVVDEIRAMGTSGPYSLSHPDPTIGGERIEILVRDRNQPARLLRSDLKLRFLDYTIEPFTGRILFRAPIPSVDADLNPVSIRVTYERSDEGERFWVYGAEGRLRPGAFSIGGSASRDEDPLSPRALVSGDVGYTLGERLTVTAEAARSDSGGTFGDGAKFGDSGRIEARYTQKLIQAEAHALYTEPGFDNPSSAVVPGRRELGLTARAGVDTATSAFFQALDTRDVVTGGYRRGYDMGAEYETDFGLGALVGYRSAIETQNPASPATADAAPLKVRTLRGRLSYELPRYWRSSVFAEHEEDIHTGSQHRTSFGGDVHLTEKTRGYVKYEDISSLAGPFALNPDQRQRTTVFGLASQELRDGQVFTEYRLRDAFAGREAQAAMGLRNRWTPSEGFHVDASYERVAVLYGGVGLATAVTGGLEYVRDPRWKGAGRLEYRTQLGTEQWLTTAAATRKLTRDWAALGRVVWLAVPDEVRVDGRANIGLAFRETDRNQWNGLARYETRHQKAGGVDPFRRIAHIVSAHADYKPVPRWTFTGQFAGKWQRDVVEVASSYTVSQLVAGRMLVDLNRRLDAGLTGRGMFSGGGEYGIGGELGWLAARNLRVAAGYNVFGFHADDLDALGSTDHGFFVDLGFKFDQSLFGIGAPSGSGSTP